MRYKVKAIAFWMSSFEDACIKLGFPREDAASKTYESYLRNYVNKEDKK